MPDPEPQDGFTLIFNPATGDGWNCPDPAVDDWVDKGWTKTRPTKAKTTIKEG